MSLTQLWWKVINLINPQGRGEDFTSFLISFDVKKRIVLSAGPGLWEEGCQAHRELSHPATSSLWPQGASDSLWVQVSLLLTSKQYALCLTYTVTPRWAPIHPPEPSSYAPVSSAFTGPPYLLQKRRACSLACGSFTSLLFRFQLLLCGAAYNCLQIWSPPTPVTLWPPQGPRATVGLHCQYSSQCSAHRSWLLLVY